MSKLSTKKYTVIFIIIISILPIIAKGQGRWIKIESKIKSKLVSVDFMSPDTGWIASINDTILKTNDGGINWVFQKTEYSSLNFIRFLSPNVGFVLGSSYVDWGPHMTIESSNNGGENWSLSYWGGLGYLSSLDFVSFSSGWAIGYERSLMVPPFGYTIVLYTYDIGSYWQEIYREENGPHFNSIDFIDWRKGWAVGNKGVIRMTNDGGQTWNIQNSENSNSLNSVNFVSLNEGWAVGDSGTILHTLDGGLNWFKRQIGTIQNLNDVLFSSSTEGWIIGDSGIILHTENGGQNWNYRESYTKLDLYSLDFVSTQVGWVVGDNGIILKYINSSEIVKHDTKTFLTNFILFPNYPNPFNQSTIINYHLPQDLKVTINIYSITGKHIKTLIDNIQIKGYHSVIWNGKDEIGNEVSSGIYIYKLISDGYVSSRKMMLLR